MNAVVSVPRTMRTIITGSEQTLLSLRYKSKLPNTGGKVTKGFLLEAIKQIVVLFICVHSAGIPQLLQSGKTDFEMSFQKQHARSFKLGRVHLSLDNRNGRSTVCYSLPTLLIRAAMWAAL